MTLLPWKRRADRGGPTPSSFEELALPLLPSLYNLARWLAVDTAEAEDLVQETFLKALRGFDGFEPGTNFRAWIFRILRNTYLTSRTGLAARRTVALEDEWQKWDLPGVEHHPEAIIDRQTPEANLLRLADREAVRGAMEKLPPLLLEALLLCDVEEMKYREIAEVLDVPIGTVMSRVARARAALRDALERQSSSSKEFRA
jgi:RNA polymerase sigma-70 factor (ECF subfamily)